MFVFISLAIIVAIFAAVVQDNRSKARKLQQLKQAYEQSLKGSNKRTALMAGRTYYCALRNDKVLTIYDEQAIANDLSTMNDFIPSGHLQ